MCSASCVGQNVKTTLAGNLRNARSRTLECAAFSQTSSRCHDFVSILRKIQDGSSTAYQILRHIHHLIHSSRLAFGINAADWITVLVAVEYVKKPRRTPSHGPPLGCHQRREPQHPKPHAFGIRRIRRRLTEVGKQHIKCGLVLLTFS